ncbi:MAG: nitroreductase family protein [Promethearchaeota archaeon]
MNVSEVIKKRKSIRKFKQGDITPKHLKLILKAAQLSPSASNRQPYHFIIVKDPEFKKQLGIFAAHQKFIADAAIIIVGLGDIEREKWYKVDLAIAFQQMILQATELGYGSIWIGAFNEEKIKNLLKIPDKFEVIALLPIGIADQDPPARPRKSLQELFFLNEYGSPLDQDFE